MQASVYLDDLGGLSAHRALERLDLLGHSAGGTLAVLYAARHPERVGRLALLNPSPRVVGLDIADADRREVARPLVDALLGAHGGGPVR